MAKHYRKLTIVLASDDDLVRPKYKIEDLTEYSTAQCANVSGQGPKSITASGTLAVSLPLTPVKVLVVQVTGQVEARINGAVAGFKVQSVGTVGADDFNYGFLYLTDTEVTALSLVNLSATEAAEVEIGFGG